MQKIVLFIRSTTGRIALTYLGIIMLMSIVFSLLLYTVSSRELGRQLPPRGFMENRLGGQDNSRAIFNEYLEERIEDGRRNIALRLVTLNVLVLIAGAGASYILARRTLEPIEAAMEAQARFVSDASHELRTPLTAMQTTNEVALRRKKLTSDDARSIIAANIEEIENLKRLSDGLLKLAKHDGALQKEPISLQSVMSDALTQIVAQAQAKSISVDDAVPNLTVPADALSLCQAFVIVLDNAVKYSPEGSVIHVSAERKSKEVLIHIRDEGIGMKSVDMEHIFDRFYRADQSRTKQQTHGYGLGLSIAKNIMEHHGGSISVVSTPAVGSTFTLTLPL